MCLSTKHSLRGFDFLVVKSGAQQDHYPEESVVALRPAKASNKNIAKSEIIIKDVCLLPSSCWEEVSRRHIKQDLINRNLFIEVWSLDKCWSEQQLRLDLLNLFKSHLSGTTE